MYLTDNYHIGKVQLQRKKENLFKYSSRGKIQHSGPQWNLPELTTTTPFQVKPS